MGHNECPINKPPKKKKFKLGLSAFATVVFAAFELSNAPHQFYCVAFKINYY